MHWMIRIEKFRGKKGVFAVKRMTNCMSPFEIDLSIWLYGFNLELDTGYWGGDDGR